jgi:hypothetical protein
MMIRNEQARSKGVYKKVREYCPYLKTKKSIKKI